MNFFEKITKRYGRYKLIILYGDVLLLIIGSFISLNIYYSIQNLLVFKIIPVFPKLIEFIVSISLVIVTFRYYNLYNYKYLFSLLDQSANIIRCVLISAVTIIIFSYFFFWDTAYKGARIQPVLFLVINSALLISYRMLIVKKFVRSKKYKDVFRRRILAIGAGEVGKRFVKELNRNESHGLSFIGFIDDDPGKLGTDISGYEVIGTVNEAEKIVKKFRIDEIFITIQSISYQKILDLIQIGKNTNCQVNLITTHYSIIERKVHTVRYNGISYVPIFQTAFSIYNGTIKRTVDIVFSILSLIILSPILIAITAAIKLNSKGPVFYKAPVIGKDGKTFNIFKFRTMEVNSGTELHQKHLEKLIKENLSTEKIKNDPRITKPGKFLRKYSLDELAQFINVLRGEMSLIGPRPCLPYEYELMDEWQKNRTKVTPGITGLWQITGRNRHDVTFNDSIVLDLYYADNQSLWFDIIILFKTIPVIFNGKGGQ